MEQSSGTSTQLGAAHTQAKTVVQSTQLWEAERCLLCVCVWGGWGGVGGRECQSCIHAALGGWVMCVCVGGGGGGVGAVVQSTPTLHKNSDTLHNETLSLSLSLSKVGILFLPVL